MSNIVHDWADDEACAILRAFREAATDSTLLLMEFVVPEDFEATNIDILILVGRRERTERQCDELLASSGGI